MCTRGGEKREEKVAERWLHSLNPCSHLIGCYTPRNGEEGDVKLCLYRCEFCQVWWQQHPLWDEEDEVERVNDGVRQAVPSFPGDKTSREHFCLSFWQTSCHSPTKSGRTVSLPGRGSLMCWTVGPVWLRLATILWDITNVSMSTRQMSLRP